MKKLLLLFLIFISFLLVGCNSYKNNDLTEIEAVLNNLINLENSWEYNFSDSVDAVSNYLINYQGLFTEETEYLGFIMGYSKVEIYDNLRILQVQFIIKNIDKEYLDKETVNNFIIVYEQTIKDLKSLIGENYLRIDISFECANKSLVRIYTGNHPYGGNQVFIIQNQDTIELSDIRNGFKNWERLLKIEELDAAYLSIGKSEIPQFNFLNIQLLFMENKYWFGIDSEYGLSREDINQIILDNTDGLILYE